MAFLNENGLHALRECCDALYLSKADASNIYLSKGDAEHLPYLPLSGGIMTGQIKQTSQSENSSYGYWNSKNTCCLYTANAPDANHYFPVVGMNSVDGGTLSIGAVAGNTNTDTQYYAGTGLSLSGTTFSLASSGATSGSYGPSANVYGSNGATISVPQITVDSYGRVTSIVNRTYTSVNTDTNTTYSAIPEGTITALFK